MKALNNSPKSSLVSLVNRALSAEFFARPTLAVARELLGKFLVKADGEKEIARMITEVEVYDGFEDKASHAHKGKTLRNAAMFGEPGVWYVYFTYGVHWMLNITTREAGYPAAILIRGVEGISGPGRLTKAYGIDKLFNERPAAHATGLWIEDRGITISPRKILRTPRIGIASAGPIWSKKPYRLLLK